jgi:hypothetical protein
MGNFQERAMKKGMGERFPFPGMNDGSLNEL